VLRRLLLLAAVLLGVFAVAAFVFRRADVSQATQSIVGGALAYAFIVGAATLWVLDRRRRQGLSERRVVRYLAEHPRVQSAVGRPVRVGAPTGDLRGKAGQVNLSVPVSGPLGEAVAHLVMARLDSAWEVLAADLVVDGERVPLTGVSGIS
jgi:hypothetical protein